VRKSGPDLKLDTARIASSAMPDQPTSRPAPQAERGGVDDLDLPQPVPATSNAGAMGRWRCAGAAGMVEASSQFAA
jgi:hypothetical protein